MQRWEVIQSLTVWKILIHTAASTVLSRGVTMPSTLSNTDLKPERMHSYEIGTDFRMFDNRLGLDLTYYNTLNTNQIVQIPISATSGYDTRYINAGGNP